MIPSIYVFELPHIPAGTRFHGRQLKGLLYRLIRPGAPEPHNQPRKGFTTAVILSAPGKDREQPMRVRFGLTDPTIETALADMMRGLHPSPNLTLAGRSFEARELRIHQASKQQALSTLLETARPDRHIRLAFRSPTAYRESVGPEALALTRNSREVLWPEPQRVFGSLLSAWRAVPDAPALPTALDRLVQCGIAVSQHSLRSVASAHHSRGGCFGNRVRGFIGWCEFTIISDATELRCHLNALADFATFCGTGVYRTEGMGFAERISRSESG